MQVSDNSPLELNYNSDEAKQALHQTFTNLPDDANVYLIGGSVRNALYRMFHGDVLVQRDYDQVITNGTKEYTQYLESIGFEKRPYPSHQDEQVAYSKALNEHAKEGDSYTNWLVFDLHTLDGATIEESIKTNVAFTINGCAVDVRNLYNKRWQDSVIEVLPNAIQDIKDKRLRVNRDGCYWPSNFFAMLRFMSVGFTPPPQDEVQLLLKELPNVEHARFGRNVTKVWNYVGGEEKARALVKSLGIGIDVFDEDTVKSAKL